MGTPLLRCGQVLRTRIAASSGQQLRHKSIFSDITDRLKSQVDSNPELKEQLSKLKGTAEQLQKQAAASVQQAQEVAQEVYKQTTGASNQQSAASGAQPGPGSAADSSGASSDAGGGSGGSTGADSQSAGPEAGANSSSSGTDSSAEANTGNSTGSSRTSWTQRGRGMLSSVWTEVQQAVNPDTEVASATRRRADVGARPLDTEGGPSELLIVKQPQSAWGKRWQALADKYGDSPLFRRLRSAGGSAAARGRDAAEDLREKWETSDSPFVHRIQDMSDSMFAETEMARAYREIASRDAAFDMPAFLRQVKADVPVIVRAYLLGEIDVLKEHCSPEMVERLTGIISAQQAQGMYSDATLLDISEVELVDIKLLEDDPAVVVQFNCQQINCVRDKFGNVTEGAPDDVQKVYYFWALQQDPAGHVGADGKLYPPRWQLREMLVKGMIPLIG